MSGKGWTRTSVPRLTREGLLLAPCIEGDLGTAVCPACCRAEARRGAHGTRVGRAANPRALGRLQSWRVTAGAYRGTGSQGLRCLLHERRRSCSAPGTAAPRRRCGRRMNTTQITHQKCALSLTTNFLPPKSQSALRRVRVRQSLEVKWRDGSSLVRGLSRVLGASCSEQSPCVSTGPGPAQLCSRWAAGAAQIGVCNGKS